MSPSITGTHKQQENKVSLKREKMAGFLYDMAKIIFSATVITSVMAFAEDNFESFHLFLLIGGFITTWLCAWWANRVLTY